MQYKKKLFLSLGVFLGATQARALELDGKYTFCADAQTQVRQAEGDLLTKAKRLCENPVLTTPFFHWADRGCTRYMNGWHVRADVMCAPIGAQETGRELAHASISVADCSQALFYDEVETWEPESFRPLWRTLAEKALRVCNSSAVQVISESVKVTCSQGNLAATGEFVCIE